MKRPNRKHYDLNDIFECVKYIKDNESYIDYLETRDKKLTELEAKDEWFNKGIEPSNEVLFCHHNGTYETIIDIDGNRICCKCKKRSKDF